MNTTRYCLILLGKNYNIGIVIIAVLFDPSFTGEDFSLKFSALLANHQLQTGYKQLKK